jgi:hypothetical protein
MNHASQSLFLAFLVKPFLPQISRNSLNSNDFQPAPICVELTPKSVQWKYAAMYASLRHRDSYSEKHRKKCHKIHWMHTFSEDQV